MAYYDALLAVSQNNDWLNWSKFFIKGVIEQAADNIDRAKKITDFYSELKSEVPKMTKSQYGITAIDFIFKRNYFVSSDFLQYS